jgi:hypothetical protein
LLVLAGAAEANDSVAIKSFMAMHVQGYQPA